MREGVTDLGITELVAPTFRKPELNRTEMPEDNGWTPPVITTSSDHSARPLSRYTNV